MFNLPDSLLSALIQAPFVLVMVYLIQRFLSHLSARDQEWRTFTEKIQHTYGARLEGLTEAIDRLTHIMIAHDIATRAPDRHPTESDPPQIVRRVR